jgi:hypothetical protein
MPPQGNEIDLEIPVLQFRKEVEEKKDAWSTRTVDNKIPKQEFDLMISNFGFEIVETIPNGVCGYMCMYVSIKILTFVCACIMCIFLIIYIYIYIHMQIGMLVSGDRVSRRWVHRNG